MRGVSAASTVSTVSTRMSRTIARVLKIHRGEETRVLGFFVLHVLISLVIGMTSTVVDSLVISLRTTGTTTVLYGVSAVMLMGTGLLYAGVTDRVDKRRLFFRALLASAAVGVVMAFFLYLRDALGDMPLLTAALFVWRFMGGILLLLLFWDMAPFYFNARQGKRIFPLLAMGGAVGYSMGSLVVVPMARFLPWGGQFLAIAAVSLACGAVFFAIRRSFAIQEAPRYRSKSIAAELREGITAFRSNAFLRAVGANTVLFGILAGLIILTYNAVLDARTDTSSQAASLMGYQRAVATILQAVVLTKVMSQSALGGRNAKEIVQQAVFFVLGVVAFVVSMVGVADFTRQIEVALMSPAAMAAFAFLPSAYRGRVMVLNNIVAAAAGILAGTVLVVLLRGFVDPRVFIYLIAVLMVARMGFNVVLNRRYVSLLSESLLADNHLNLKRIEENSASILRDEALLHALLRKIEGGDRSSRMFVLARLAESAETPEDIQRLAPFFDSVRHGSSGHEEDTQGMRGSLMELRIQTLARVSYETFRGEIEEAAAAGSREIQLTARLLRLKWLARHERPDQREVFHQEVEELAVELRETADLQRFRDVATLLLRVERETGHPLAEVPWHTMDHERLSVWFQVLGDHPGVHQLNCVLAHLGQESHGTAAARVLQGMPEDLLLERRSDLHLASLEPRRRVELLERLAVNHSALARLEAEDVLRTVLGELDDDPENREDWGSLYVRLRDQATWITGAALLSLADPSPAAPEVRRLAERGEQVFGGVYLPLLVLRYRTSEEEQGRYHSLLVKMVDEQLRDLTLVVLALRALQLPREDDRQLAVTVCRDIRTAAGFPGHTVLEFVETRSSPAVRRFMLVYLEALSDSEKEARVRSLARGQTLPGGHSVEITELLSVLEGQLQPREPSLHHEIVRRCLDPPVAHPAVFSR